VFHVGQKVVCIDVSSHKQKGHLRPTYASTVTPTLGGVYTVRDIFDASVYGHDEPGLLLDEIVNPVRRYISLAGPCECEQFFLAFRFRPVRTTNIDVFTKMLEPVPVREPAQLLASRAPHRPHACRVVMYQLTPEALLESMNRIADLPASERSRLRRDREAYRKKRN
jgi:hypothetical protein